MKDPIALITGATSGIGEATARQLAKTYRLIICGRRKERLQSLKDQLNTEVIWRSFDVRDRKATYEAIAGLPDEWQNIEVLINNAGNAHGLDPIHTGNEQDWDAMIDINVKGLLNVSKAIMPGMVERAKGHIINIGSVAGIEVYENGNIYCASKHAVDAITKGMRLDLTKYGIKVTGLNPGLVQTEFSMVRFKGDEERAMKVYENYDPLQPEDIAATIAFVLSRPPHVTIADMLIFPSAQSSATVVNKSRGNFPSQNS